MAFRQNSNNQPNDWSEKDQKIRRKMAGLSDPDYNSKGGWDKLSKRLPGEIVTVENDKDSPRKDIISSKRNKQSLLPVWKMAAAAVVLLAAGFLAGRLTTDFSGQHLQNSYWLTMQSQPKGTAQTPSVHKTRPMAGSADLPQSLTASASNTARPTSAATQAAPFKALVKSKKTKMKENKAPASKQINDQRLLALTKVRKENTGQIPVNANSSSSAANQPLQLNTTPEMNNRKNPIAFTSLNEADYHKKQEPQPKPLPVISIAEINMNAPDLAFPGKPYPMGSAKKSQSNMYQVISGHQGASGSSPVSIRF